MNLRRVPT